MLVTISLLRNEKYEVGAKIHNSQTGATTLAPETTASNTTSSTEFQREIRDD
jgi:hypothetical protein